MGKHWKHKVDDRLCQHCNNSIAIYANNSNDLDTCFDCFFYDKGKRKRQKRVVYLNNQAHFIEV